MTKEQFNNISFRKGTVVESEAFLTVGRKFEVIAVNFKTRDVLGKCDKGHYWLNYHEILPNEKP